MYTCALSSPYMYIYMCIYAPSPYTIRVCLYLYTCLYLSFNGNNKECILVDWNRNFGRTRTKECILLSLVSWILSSTGTRVCTHVLTEGSIMLVSLYYFHWNEGTYPIFHSMGTTGNSNSNNYSYISMIGNQLELLYMYMFIQLPTYIYMYRTNLINLFIYIYMCIGLEFLYTFILR